MSGVIGTNLVAQVGFIVKDVEETKKKWAEFLGVAILRRNLLGTIRLQEQSLKENPLQMHIVGWHSLTLVQDYSLN